MKALEPTEVQRDRCREFLKMLRDLARIHIEIDAPAREVKAEEPEWVLLVRKVCLHAIAITKSEINVDGVHVITAELSGGVRADGRGMGMPARRVPASR